LAASPEELQQAGAPGWDQLDPPTRDFYCRALTALKASRVPFLLVGAFAFERYTGIERHTRDLDVCVRPADRDRLLEALSAAGWRTEITFEHWLGKAFCGDAYIDVIFSSGNALGEVDEGWFDHAVEAEVLGIPVKLCAPEEMIWHKAFVMERERYDGADIAHVLRACAEQLDWPRLLVRFGPHWQVLLSHLVLFGFIYPTERSKIPQWVMERLLRRLQSELDSRPPVERVCQGTLLSREQYLTDVERWDYRDARLLPRGNMTAEEIAEWTAPVERDE
jgi:hypothetical protein